MTSSFLDWLLFFLLASMWGSSYLFVKIGVEAGMLPFSFVTLRLAIGFALLAGVAIAKGETMPREMRTYGHLLVIAVLSVALPFSLISWAEQRVDSTLAAVIGGAIPLFVMVIAAFTLRDEPITMPRLMGLLVGLSGVALLVGFDPGGLAGTNMPATLALLASTISYACGGVYARRFVGGLRPGVIAVVQIGFAFVISLSLAIGVEHSVSFAPRLEAMVAVLWLGLLASGLAFLIFFRLLARWGAIRTSTVAYLLPVFGLTLGAVVLNEPVDSRLIVGTALVVAGIALVSVRPRLRPSTLGA
jgi:drug/metabolite transporter (DMT)-like permease